MANITGTALRDVLRGTDQSDSIRGEDGNDVLIGLAGNDNLDGGRGADVMKGGAGDDIYNVDNLGDKTIDRGGGTDTVFSTVDGYRLRGQVENLKMLDIDGVLGTTAYGNGLDNTISANNGNGYSYDDTFYGRGGNDTLLGGTGSDRLIGGGGNDILNGTASAFDRIRGFSDGFDVLNGGAGGDTYVLGDENSYLGDEFVTIFGFNWRQGDKLLVEDSSLYTVGRTTSSVAGKATLDTEIYKGDDLIAVLVDKPFFNAGRDFITSI